MKPAQKPSRRLEGERTIRLDTDAAMAIVRDSLRELICASLSGFPAVKCNKDCRSS